MSHSINTKFAEYVAEDLDEVINIDLLTDLEFEFFLFLYAEYEREDRDRFHKRIANEIEWIENTRQPFIRRIVEKNSGCTKLARTKI